MTSSDYLDKIQILDLTGSDASTKKRLHDAIRAKAKQVLYPDTVVIRRWKAQPPGSRDARTRYRGSLIALFPYQPESRGQRLDDLGYPELLVNSYEHVGQHGAANYSHVISLTKTSYPHEDTSGDPSYDFDALLNELRTIGYEPVARQRRTRR